MMIDPFDDVDDPCDIADHNHCDIADHGGFLRRLGRTIWREILDRLDSVGEEDPEDSESKKRRPPPGASELN
jgi:hypothetical protein